MSDHRAPNETRPTLVLVDAQALVHQLYHAIAPMSAPDGRPTNIVFGFARDLFYFRDELQPDYLIYVFDPPGRTFRDELVGNYKANRKEADDDLKAQIPLLYRLLESANVPQLCIPGYEADDVIATVAKAGEARGFDVMICSSDKDCRQLVTEHVRVLNLRKRSFLDRRAIIDDWGVTPDQAIDFQTLVGDSVDNVKGVKGIGEKTAAKLLQQFGTLDNLVANVDNLGKVVPAKIQASLKEAASGDELKIARKLVTLDTAVPLNFDWEKWHRPEWDAEKLKTLFQELGFRTWLAKLHASSPTVPSGSLFSAFEPPAGDGAAVSTGVSNWKGDYQLVDTPEKFEAFLKELKRRRRLAIDLETTGLDPHTCDLVGIAICWTEGEAYYLAVRGPAGAATLDEAHVLASLKPLLEDETIFKVNQNIKFDQNVLRRLGISLRGVAGDPMVADYLLHAGDRGHGLDEMALRYFQHQNISIEQLIGKKGKKQKTMDQIETDKVCAYAGEDADVAWRLAELLEPQLDRDGLRRLYDELELPLIEVLAELEYTGIRLDVAFLKRLSEEMAGQMAVMEREIHAAAGRSFNIDSPRQLGQILFDEMQLPRQKKTGITGAASTDRETLEKLAAMGHDLPRRIVEYREVGKLKGTYVDALPALVNPRTGRLHTSFNQTVATTGRLSSSEPNLQNVPTRTDQGQQIRQAFVPEDGWVLVTADYSQIELRLLAHFCGDAELRKAFADDRDVHATVAAQIFGVPEDEVTTSQRRVAKTVNFGVIYGMSAFGLSTRLAIPRHEGERFIDQYFARYPKVLEYQQQLLAQCRERGYVSTILGRRRLFNRTAIRANSTYQFRNQAEREAINMEIQGSAADLIKVAMLHTYRRMRSEALRSRMLLTVHDELIFESPPEELPRLATLVRREMTEAMKFDVPLKVDVASGKNWLEVHSL